MNKTHIKQIIRNNFKIHQISYLIPVIPKTWQETWQQKNVMQSCGRKAISVIGPDDTQTAGPQDKKTRVRLFKLSRQVSNRTER